MSNAYATYPLHRDSFPKGELIPDSTRNGHPRKVKDLLVKDGHA